MRFLVAALLTLFFIPVYAANTVDANTVQCYYIKRCPNGVCKWHERCGQAENIEEQNRAFFSPPGSDEISDYQKRVNEQKRAAKNPFVISFYNPTYILPYYYTFDPYQQVYQGNTPDNQAIEPSEFKAQFSFQFPLWPNMFGSRHVSLDVAYTQLMYWQFYARSQYFRETDYEPEVFVNYNFARNFFALVGAVHQSNGRGGQMERSWNRAYVDLRLSTSNWLFSIKPWILIFAHDSSDIHNADISRYLGYERIVVAYKFHHQELSLMARNTFESGFKRGALQFDYTFPIYKRLNGMVQVFSGYGQSLIEYNHYTDAIGAGISLSNWL